MAVSFVNHCKKKGREAHALLEKAVDAERRDDEGRADQEVAHGGRPFHLLSIWSSR